jgi:uncharacterized protein YlzI (FlbEa/FlbD family)
MNKGYRPLIVEDVRGRRHFINCYEVFFIEPCSVMPNVSIVHLAEGKTFYVTNAVAEILKDRLVDELFFTAESIEKEKAILSQPEEQDDV